MNRGVALLLERRKTHPEEFAPHAGRWNTLLVSFEAYPLTRDTKPCNPREFNQLVTQRILTASDLAEPWMIKLSQAQIKVAQRLGIAPEAYAKIMSQYERRTAKATGGSDE